MGIFGVITWLVGINLFTKSACSSKYGLEVEGFRTWEAVRASREICGSRRNCRCQTYKLQWDELEKPSHMTLLHAFMTYFKHLQATRQLPSLLAGVL